MGQPAHFGPVSAVADRLVGPWALEMLSKSFRTTLERPRHETRISRLYPCHCCRSFSPVCDGANSQDGQGPRHVVLRREPGTAGILLARRQGHLDWTRRRCLPCDRRHHFQRSDQGQVRAAVGQGSLHGSSIRQNDVLSRNTTWTLSRDTTLGANFTGVTYYDGQGFIVKKSLKVNSALELNSASVCVQTGTTTEQNLADYFKGNNMKYEVIAFGTADEAVKAYEAGRCD